LTKTNEILNTNEPQETFFNSPGENYAFHPPVKPKNHSRRWKYTLPDLAKICFICDNQIKVKYILPKKQYSQKNNWNYWTSQENKSPKYICNSCLTKLHVGGISKWVKEEKAENFYVYFNRGSFSKIENQKTAIKLT